MFKFTREKALIYTAPLMLALALQGCAKKTDSSSSTATATSGLTSNMTTVSSSMVPKSLNTTTGLLEMAASRGAALGNPWELAASSNPCEGYDLFGCQPVLLRLYIYMAKMFFDASKQIVDGTGTALGNLADGASGTHTEGTTKIEYKKTTATDYGILIKGATSGETFGSVVVKDTTATIKIDFDKNPDKKTGDPTGAFETSFTYTDASNWTMSLFFINTTCDAADVRAPQRIKVLISKASDLWKGKAMLYGPRWAPVRKSNADYTPTCSDTPTDATSFLLYTDFVGNDIAAKANVYAMQRDLASLASISTYAMSKLCDNYSLNFFDVASCPSTWSTALAAYPNPFCNPDATDKAEWNNTCSTYSTAVGAAEFGAATDWVTPNAFYQATISLPTALAQ